MVKQVLQTWWRPKILGFFKSWSLYHEQDEWNGNQVCKLNSTDTRYVNLPQFTETFKSNICSGVHVNPFEQDVSQWPLFLITDFSVTSGATGSPNTANWSWVCRSSFSASPICGFHTLQLQILTWNLGSQCIFSTITQGGASIVKNSQQTSMHSPDKIALQLHQYRPLWPMPFYWHHWSDYTSKIKKYANQSLFNISACRRTA